MRMIDSSTQRDRRIVVFFQADLSNDDPASPGARILPSCLSQVQQIIVK